MSQKDERRPARNAAANTRLPPNASNTIGPSQPARAEAQAILDRAARRLLAERLAQAKQAQRAGATS